MVDERRNTAGGRAANCRGTGVGCAGSASAVGATGTPDPPNQAELLMVFDGGRWLTWGQWKRRQLDLVFGRRMPERREYQRR